MPEDLVIVGCGGLGRETVSTVHAVNRSRTKPTWNFLGFVDDAPSPQNVARVERAGLEVIGATTDLLGPLRRAHYVIAIGSPQARASVARTLYDTQRAATLVHPTALVGQSVRLGSGVIVGAGAHLACDIDVGDHVVLDRGVQVGHDCTIGDFVTLHPAAVVSGTCTIGEMSLLGTHATVIQGLSVAREATVGAGACVTRPVPEGAVVKGVPAR